MRKNINKLVAVAIGVSIMSGSAIPVFAADTATTNTITASTTVANTSTNVQAQTNVKPVFTLDDAIKAAEGNSETLALDDKKISYQNKINDINEKIDDATVVTGDKETYNEDTRDNSMNQLKQRRDFDEDKLIQKTTTAYNNIVTSQIKIDKAAKVLEIKTKELSDAKLKKELGLMTSIDVGNTELQIENQQNQQNLSIKTLKDAQDSFKVLTGKDASKFILEQDIKYEQFKIDGSVDEYLDNVIDKYLKYTTEELKLKKDYYNDTANQVSEDASDNPPAVNTKPGTGADAKTYMEYLDSLDKHTDAISGYATTLSKRLTYLNNKLGVYTQETNLVETRKTYKESLKTLYTNLIAAEENINYLKNNIQLSNKQLGTIKLKYDLGLITKSEYNTQVAGNQDLDIQLRTAVESYNTLKEKIQKPWLAF